MNKQEITDFLEHHRRNSDINQIMDAMDVLIEKLQDEIRQEITFEGLQEIGFVVDEKWPNIVSYYVSGGLELFFSLTQQTIALQEGFFQNGEARFVHLPMIKTYEQLNTLLLLLTTQQ